MEDIGLIRVSVPSSDFNFNAYVKHPQGDEGYIVCQHGVGSSAATFTLFIEALSQLNPKLGFIAYDLRHHGFTKAIDPQKVPAQITDLDIDTLCSDLHHIIDYLVKLNPAQGSDKPPIALLGHSMGGSVVSKFNEIYDSKYTVRGVVVIDAVEGYATKSLASMHMLLGMWPEKFASIDDAIKWYIYDAAQVRNKKSARISVPPLLVETPDAQGLEWKLDLKRTSKNWDTWFKDLDSMFVSARCARLLVLSGVSKLDTDLTRAQMQGKFQMCVVPESGHYIQEDAPMKVAQVVCDFWERNSVVARIVPKFGKFRDN